MLAPYRPSEVCTENASTEHSISHYDFPRFERNEFVRLLISEDEIVDFMAMIKMHMLILGIG